MQCSLVRQNAGSIKISKQAMLRRDQQMFNEGGIAAVKLTWGLGTMLGIGNLEFFSPSKVHVGHICIADDAQFIEVSRLVLPPHLHFQLHFQFDWCEKAIQLQLYFRLFSN